MKNKGQIIYEIKKVNEKLNNLSTKCEEEDYL